MVNKFTIMTDVNTDVDPEYAKTEGIVILPQYYHFSDGIIYGDEINMESELFYQRLSAGEQSLSVGCNPARVTELFEIELSKGNDIFCVIFSSRLSGSYNTACIVARDLLEKYRERKIIVIDSLNASAGAGLMLHMARNMQKSGCSMEEIRDCVEKKKKYFQAMFVVDDLQYLVRGGRLSSFSGKVGTMLDIKPILYLTDGEIVAIRKKRTRKRAVEELIDMMKKMNPDPEYFCVVHTNNYESGVELAERVGKELGIGHPIEKIVEINHTIGTHTGPNALGFGFLSEKTAEEAELI